MKILLLTPYYPIVNAVNLQGDTKVVHYFAKEWIKTGNEVLVVHTYYHSIRSIHSNFLRKIKKSKINKRKENIKLENLDGVKLALFEQQRLLPKTSELNIIQKRKRIKFVENLLSENSFIPDVIIFHFPSYYLDLINYFSSKYKLIGINHRTDLETFLESDNKSYETLNKLDGIGFRSFYLEKKYKESFETKNNTFIVNSGVPDTQLPDNFMEFKKEMDMSTAKILCVGKLVKNKNFDKVIQAFSKLKYKNEWSLTIIGEGPEELKLKKMISDLNLNKSVRILPPVSRDEIFEYMKKSDIFVMVSIKETLGLVYLEAMVNNCIVIGSKNEGIDGIIVNNENGFLVENGNVAQLLNIFNLLKSSNANFLYDLQEKSYNKIISMSESKVAHDYLINIKNILNKKVES